MEIKKLKEKVTAKKVGEFLTSDKAFTHNWYPGEKNQVKKAVFDSLGNKNHKYWYIENDGEIIAALGVRENHCNNGGYEMDDDYVAVHKDYRNRGLAKKLLQSMESYVIKNNGRYIHILTCDVESYIPARSFYEKNNYKKSAHLPNYYSIGEGRIDYYKEL